MGWRSFMILGTSSYDSCIHSYFICKANDLIKEYSNFKYALIHLDIRKFSYISYRYGYMEGNRIIEELEHYINLQLAENELGQKIDGDHFILMWSYDNLDDLRSRYYCFIETFKKQLNRYPFLKLCSGIYTVDQGEKVLEDMFQCARIANMEGKQEGRKENEAVFYSNEMFQKYIWEINLEENIEKAIEGEELELYFQEQVSLQNKIKEINRAEVLVRWIRNGELYAPTGEFIRFFEEKGKIRQLDYYILRKSCRFLQTVKQAGLGPLKLAINVSRLTVLDDDFIRHCRKIREEYGIGHGEIELEITENIAISNYKEFGKIIKDLHTNGFTCAMDDFGTGHSSLIALSHLPVDVLKLDRMFFKDKSDSQWKIVSKIMELAIELGMEVVAEGVEDMETVLRLTELNCNYIQGYIYGKPVPASVYRKNLETRTGGEHGENKEFEQIHRVSQYAAGL